MMHSDMYLVTSPSRDDIDLLVSYHPVEDPQRDGLRLYCILFQLYSRGY